MTIIIPPNNVALERAVLGASFHSAVAARALGDVPPECFTLDKHHVLHRVLGRVVPCLNGRPPDPALVHAAAVVAGEPLDAVFLAELHDEGLLVVDVAPYLVLLRDFAALREEAAITAMFAAAQARGQTEGPNPALWRAVHERLTRAATFRSSAGVVTPLGIGLGEFMGQRDPEEEPYIEGILLPDGNGWIAGEEKLGKSYWAEAEALGLALGTTIAGRFRVPRSRRVLFIQVEDPPRRTRMRFRALTRGYGLDPDDPEVRAVLNQWFKLEEWSGFTLDDPAWSARLDATCATFNPSVVYLDVFRKLTAKDLNKAAEAGVVLATLDERRRRYGVIFRVLHHYRKSQGFRVGRGSQEIGGSFVLGAWGECSLFFEPIGRKQGAVLVSAQVKDGPPVPAFKVAFHAEGRPHAPTLVRLVAEDEVPDVGIDDLLAQALATLPTEAAHKGEPGVTVKALMAGLKRSEKTIRNSLKSLQGLKRCAEVGTTTNQAKLYALTSQC